MKIYFLCAVSVLGLSGCGPDRLISDQKSPNGKYHIQIRECPTPGGFGDDSGLLAVSLLPKGKSEGCWDDINSIAQFHVSQHAHLDIEWISDTKVRAWTPGLKENQPPSGYSYYENDPVGFVFYPKKSEEIKSGSVKLDLTNP